MSGYLEKYLVPLSAIALVLPFTPSDISEQTSMAHLRGQLHTRITELTSTGRTVLLLGHSFGSVLVIETLREYGCGVGIAGLLLLCWCSHMSLACKRSSWL